MVNTKEMTMICMQSDGSYKTRTLVIGHTIIIATILLTFGFLVFFSRKLQYFLIKERAPKIALAQIIIFMLTLLVPYAVEITGYFGYSWEDITLTRRLIKSAYIASRQLAYTTFGLR